MVGAPGSFDPSNETGSAYVFFRDETVWRQQAELVSADAAVQDFFGRSVAIDGEYVVVGAYQDDDMGSASGSAYVFKRDGTSWSEQDKLIADDGESGEYFGFSTAIDCNTVVIGAMWDDDLGSSSGSAYVFQRDGVTWSQQSKLTASDGMASDTFGMSVSISGGRIAVASDRAVYFFEYNGTAWIEQSKLTVSVGGVARSICLDNDSLIVGVFGSAYIIRRDGATWTEQVHLFDPDPLQYNFFGFSVGIDGDLAVVGAYGDSGLWRKIRGSLCLSTPGW